MLQLVQQTGPGTASNNIINSDKPHGTHIGTCRRISLLCRIITTRSASQLSQSKYNTATYYPSMM